MHSNSPNTPETLDQIRRGSKTIPRRLSAGLDSELGQNLREVVEGSGSSPGRPALRRGIEQRRCYGVWAATRRHPAKPRRVRASRTAVRGWLVLGLQRERKNQRDREEAVSLVPDFGPSPVYLCDPSCPSDKKDIRQKNKIRPTFTKIR